MRHLHKMTMTGTDGVMEGLEAAHLAGIMGGARLMPGDGYCGTPWPRPPIPWTVAGSVVSLYLNPAVGGAVLAPQYGGGQDPPVPGGRPGARGGGGALSGPGGVRPQPRRARVVAGGSGA